MVLYPNSELIVVVESNLAIFDQQLIAHEDVLFSLLVLKLL